MLLKLLAVKLPSGNIAQCPKSEKPLLAPVSREKDLLTIINLMRENGYKEQLKGAKIITLVEVART